MPKLKIRKGDEVVVIGGKDRIARKRGRVQEVNPADMTVVVAGVNIAKRHTKPNPSKNNKGGIIEQPMPISIAKVMVVCPHCGKPTRVGYRTEDDAKERVCKLCGEAIIVEEKA